MKEAQVFHRHQRGVTLLGLMFWAVLIGVVAMLVLNVLPTVNEYATIQKAVSKLAKEGNGTVPEIRAAFERTKQIEYSISSISGKDLDITKENEKLVIRFAYDKEIMLFEPVYLLIKYKGVARSN
jgi:Tfp pilus assembly protein PilE